MVISSGAYSAIGLQHAYSSHKDLTSYASARLWFYGTNTGEDWIFRFYDGTMKRTEWYFADNFNGWQQISFDLSSPDFNKANLDV